MQSFGKYEELYNQFAFFSSSSKFFKVDLDKVFQKRTVLICFSTVLNKFKKKQEKYHKHELKNQSKFDFYYFGKPWFKS